MTISADIFPSRIWSHQTSLFTKFWQHEFNIKPETEDIIGQIIYALICSNSKFLDLLIARFLQIPSGSSKLSQNFWPLLDWKIFSHVLVIHLCRRLCIAGHGKWCCTFFTFQGKENLLQHYLKMVLYNHYGYKLFTHILCACCHGKVIDVTHLISKYCIFIFQNY